MDFDLLQWLSDNLVDYGPSVLFLVCMLETSLFVGLVLPVEPLILLSAALASRGVFDARDVAAFATFGALTGDQLGFVVGRFFLDKARPPRGGIAGLWARAADRTEGLLRRHGLLGIATARVIPFVRTIMPWFAGHSGIPWPRFLVFDLLGVAMWAILNVGSGFLLGEGWLSIAREFGEEAGLVVLLIALILLGVITHRPIRGLLRTRSRGKGA